MLGLNVLFDSFPNVEAAAASLYPYLDRAMNSAIHITAGARKEQGRTFALQLKQRYPAMDAILRLMPDENPALYQRYPTPADYVASVAPWASGGLMLGIGNEAGVSDLAAQNTWYAATVEGLGKLGIRSVTPSIQTHNRFPAAAFDATYRMLAKYGGMFSLHYYGDPANGLPIDPIHETVETYCAAQGIRIQFAITELGYAKWLGAFAGYSGRIASADYAAQLVAAARRWPRVRFFVYCFGAQSPWQDFDISKDQTVQDAIVMYNLETPVSSVPDRNSLGVPVIATVTSVKNNWVNLRANTLQSATKLGEIHKGDTITVRPNKTPVLDSFQWLAIDAPVISWAADLFTWAAGQADTPVVKLDVEFVSQLGVNASLRNNDCAIAAGLALIKYAYKRAGLGNPRLLTVNKLIYDTPLAAADEPLLLSDLEDFLIGYGVNVIYKRPLTPDAIVQELQAGKPPIALVNYKYLNTTQKTDLGHYVIFTAAGEQGFWYHDSYLLGASQYITREALDKALTDLGAFAGLTYQGVSLVA